jgi:CHAT domain-containing protein
MELKTSVRPLLLGTLLLSLVQCSSESPLGSCPPRPIISDSLSLPLGNSFSGGLVENEPAVFKVIIPPGQLLRIRASAPGMDLALCLYDSHGRLQIEQDGLWSAWESVEEIHQVGQKDRADSLLVTIVPQLIVGEARKYQISTSVVSQPTDSDRRFASALGLLASADSARRRRDTQYESLLRSALAAWQEAGNSEKIAEVQFRLGEMLELHSDDEAEPHLLAALSYFDSAGCRYSKAWTRRKLADIMARTGRLLASADAYKQARLDFLSLGAFSEAVQVIQAEADVARDLGLPEQELDLHRQIISSWQQLGQPLRVAEAVLREGQVFARWGRYSEALRRYDDAKRLLGKDRDRALEARIFTAEGLAHLRLNENQHGRDLLLEALDLWGQPLENSDPTATLDALCFAFRKLGDYGMALHYCRQALALVERFGPERHAARCRYSLGLALRDRGDNQEAVALFRRARSEAQKFQDRELQATSLLAEARSTRALGDMTLALKLAMDSLNVLEAARTGSGIVDLRSSFLGDRAGYYDLATELLLETATGDQRSRQLRLAFEVDERFRARTLLDLRSSSEIRGGLPKNSRFMEAERVLSLALQGGGPTASERLVQAWWNYSLEARELSREGNPHSAQPAGLSQIQAALDSRTALVQIRLRNPSSHAWIVTRSGLEMVDLPALERIEEAVRKARDHFTQPVGFQAPSEPAVLEVTDRLVAPLVPFLTGYSRLAIVSDALLQAFPWAALPVESSNPEVLLSDRFEMIFAPSSSVLLEPRGQGHRTKHLPAPSVLFALADPVFLPWEKGGRGWTALPATAREVRAIAELAEGRAPVSLALRERANRRRLFEADWSQIGILHLATHAEVDPVLPYLSRIALSEEDERGRPVDGAFYAFQALQLPLEARLVVLSGCGTAQGATVSGEGLVGLTHSFLAAGAHQVLASLWLVPDQETADFMIDFYDSYLAGGLSESAALQAAQKNARLRGVPAYAWAGFSLFGKVSAPPPAFP